MKTNGSVSPVLLRAAAILFATGALSAFVWYSQVRAQRPVAAAVLEKSPLLLSGSKSYAGPVVDSKTLMLGSKSGVLDLKPGKSQQASQQAVAPTDPFANPPETSTAVDPLAKVPPEPANAGPAANDAPSPHQGAGWRNSAPPRAGSPGGIWHYQVWNRSRC